MPLPRVDEHHLSRADVASIQPVVEVKAALGHDQRDGDRVSMLGHVLPRFQSESDHAHRSTVGDLLETKGSVNLAWARR
jgi:hypothetical protein